MRMGFSAGRGTVRGYSSRSVSIGTAYQVLVPTEVIVSINISIGLLQDREVFIETSPNNSTWTEIARHHSNGSNTGYSTTFSVPAGWYYRYRQAGSGTVTITHNMERAL